MFDFPTNPAFGTVVATPDASYRVWDGDKWRASPSSDISAGIMYLPITGGTVSGTVSIGTLTGNPPAAASLATSGQVWLGAATARNGNSSWVSDGNPTFAYFDQLNQFQVLSQPGRFSVAGMFGVRSTDSIVSSSPTFGGIAGLFYARNDAGATSPLKQVWGQYIVAQRDPGSGSALGIEFECANWGDAQVVNSYSLSSNGVTASLWLGSGGDVNLANPLPNPLSAQIVLLNTHATPVGAEKGIVFTNGAVRRNATTTAGTAIQMASGHQLEWISDGSGTVRSFIRGTGSGNGLSILLDSAMSRISFVDAVAETPRFSVSGIGTTVIGDVTARNALTITPGAASGNSVNFTPTGTGGVSMTVPSLTVGTAAPTNALQVFPAATTNGSLVLGTSGTGGVLFATSEITIGSGSTNALAITPGVASTNQIFLSQSGTGGIAIQTPILVGTAGPQLLSGTGVPSVSGIPTGSIFIRTDGAAGSRIYVYQGAGVWNPMAGV
jgi:hypothetical protein